MSGNRSERGSILEVPVPVKITLVGRRLLKEIQSPRTLSGSFPEKELQACGYCF
jgi:hypothetical protein